MGEFIAQTTGPRTDKAGGDHKAPPVAIFTGACGVDTARATSQNDPQNPAEGGSDRLIIIALDPSHGCEDPGAIGPGGTREKEVVLQLAHRLRERINATRVGGASSSTAGWMAAKENSHTDQSLYRLMYM